MHIECFSKTLFSKNIHASVCLFGLCHILARIELLKTEFYGVMHVLEQLKNT